MRRHRMVPEPAPQPSPMPAASPWPAGRLVRGFTLLVLSAATWAAFAGVLRNGWVLFDDPLYILKNLHVSRGWTWDGALWFLHSAHGANWHPLTSWSHMLDVQLFGLNPGAHHAMSLALHVVNAVLLVLVLHGLTGKGWQSLLVGALFAIHPLRVESVAWVSERKDVLSGLFFILSLAAYRRWVRRPTRAGYALLAVCFALGLMSKPMVVTLPFVLLLLDAWPLGRMAGFPGAPAAARSPLELVREKWPLFAMAGASATVTFVFQRGSGAVAAAEAVAPARRVCTALTACWWYIAKTFWPSGLAPFYPLDRSSTIARVALGAALAATGLALVTLLAVRQRRRPWLLVGWLWFLGMLVPVLGLVQVGKQAYADRYTYLPTIGLLVAIVWGVADWISRRRAVRRAAAVTAVLALAVLAVATSRQVALWRDTRTLFTHALAVTPDNAVAEQCLADAFEADSRPAEAIRHRRRAVELDPGFANAHRGLGVLLAKSGNLVEAAAHFRRAYELEPSNPEMVRGQGLVAQAQGRTDEAAAWFERALQLAPYDAEALGQLGSVRIQAGRVAGGIALLRRAVALDPANAQPHLTFALALMTVPGRDAEAAEQLHEVVRLEPRGLDGTNALAWLLATSPDPRVRNGAEAVGLAARAVELSGGRDPNVIDTQAAALATAGRFDEAMRHARAALELIQGRQADSLARTIQDRLVLYEHRQAFVDSARGGGVTPAR